MSCTPCGKYADLFTDIRVVTWPLNGNEAGIDLVIIQNGDDDDDDDVFICSC